MVTGSSVTYIAGTGARPIPLATDGVRTQAHTTQTKKPTGLDWDNLTPTCKGCGQRSGQLGAGELCPPCRGVKPTKPKRRKAAQFAQELPEDELLRRFTGNDDTELGRALAELEARDPNVAAAAARLDAAAARITRPDDHIQAPTNPHQAGNQGRPTTRRSAPRATSPSSSPGSVPGAGSADHQEKNPAAAQETRPAAAAGLPDNVTELPARYTPEANLDAQIQHATRVLRTTAGSDDHVVRLLRLNALSAIEALHLYTELHQTPAAAASPRTAAAGPTSTTPVPPGRGGARRPAARAEGEAVARPAPGPKRRDAERQGIRERDAETRHRMHDLHATPRQIKLWAIEQGLLPELIRGRVARHIVDAYAAAHPNPTGDTTP